MGQRLDLHELLVDVLGSRNVYFQPPSGDKLKFPAIEYHLTDITSRFADDMPYATTTAYLITIIDADPDSAIPTKLLRRFTRIAFDRAFANDNLNHFVFKVYF